MKSKFIAATAVAALTSGILLAGAAWAESAKITFLTGPGAGKVLVNSVLGDEVRNNAGEKLGKIDDLGFDSDGRVATAVIGVGGFLGVGERYVAVPFRALTLDTSSGKPVFKLDISKDALKDAPKFEFPKEADATREHINEKLREWAAITKEKASEYGEKAKEKASEYGEKAKDKAGEVYDKAKDAMGTDGSKKK
jgi:sporulation protein YlmC with PRC-barrel domain